MKTVKFKTLMIAFSVAATSLFVISCDKDKNDTNDRTYSISGNANGSQMVPTVAGSGSGTITGTYNANTNVLTYTTTWNGLTGAPITGSFYTGTTGTVGTAVGTMWTFPAGTTATGTMNGSITLTDAQETQLLNGQWYYVYGTTANTSGEIRGQITATQQ